MRCPYQHNAEKVAICPRFMNDECTSNPCLLSHQPTPERVPVCVHFSNGARCKLPHVIRAKHTTGDSIASGTSIPQRDKLVETEEFIPLTFDESSEDELSGLDVSEDEPMDSEHGDDHVATSP